MTSPRIEHVGDATLYLGDCRVALDEIAEASIDSCVTDPPYHLTTDKNGGSGVASLNENSPAGRSRVTTGFMGKAWDGGDVAFTPELWAKVFRVLKPGAHLVAFGGTRTYHRLACAIEDAGFEIRDAIMWHYGSGFPKSLNVSRAIDRAAGAEREIIATGDPVRRMIPGADQNKAGWEKNNGREFVPIETAPATADAAKWSGWGTALKPATEIICLARKPLSEDTIAANVLRWGTGALNIDGCRAGDDVIEVCNQPGVDKFANMYGGNLIPKGGNTSHVGRWPANLCHDGSEEVLAAFPDAPGQQYSTGPQYDRKAEVYGKYPGVTPHEPRNDSGSAARFFYRAEKDTPCGLCGLPYRVARDSVFSCDANNVKPSSQTGNIPNGVSVRSDVVDSPSRESVGSEPQSSGIVSNADNRSPPCHPQKADSVPKNAPDWPLSRIVQNVSAAASLCGLCATDIARVLVEVRRNGCPVPVHFNPSIGSSKERILSRSLASYVAGRESTDTILTTTNLSELFGCVFAAIAENTSSGRSEASENLRPATNRLFYSSKADSDDRLGSKHPTVKPVDLMQWLCRLVTPPGGLILDPFAGTGTTAEAAIREGFRPVMIEREAEYQDDIRRRLRLVMAGPLERKHESIKARGKTESAGPLFGGP